MIRQAYVTSRLLLRTLDPSHADLVLDYFVRNRTFLAPWEPDRTEDYYTAAWQRELLSFDQRSMEEDQLYKVWVSPKAEPERIIGSVSLGNIVRGAFQSCHVGYRGDQDELNKGYVTEALEQLVSVAFGEMKLHRLEANIMPRNGASLRLVEKIGFQPEGLARKYLKINGVWEDHVHMVLLNEAME